MDAPKTTSRPTINDVARLSGVSKATVSKALDNRSRYGLSEEVRRRVTEAVEQLGYQPGGRGRVEEQVRVIGLFYARSNPYPTETYDRLIAGAAVRLADHKCRLVHVPLLGEAELWKSQIDDRQIAGGLVLPPVDRAMEALIRQSIGRFVFVNVPSSLSVSQMLCDYSEAAAVMTRHLMQLGHRRVVFCSSPGKSRSLVLREEGYQMAMQAGGCSENVSIVKDPALFLDTYKKTKGRPTAVITDTVRTAVELQHGCWARGIAVPGELSIGSLEDAYPASKLIPPLTAMHCPAEQLGAEAVNLLLDQLDGEQSILPRKVVLAESLVVRQSTAAPSDS